MINSSPRTEFVNAQLVDLKELIDYYASLIRVPTYISIITPPDKLEYRPGQSIDLTGIVVNAYYADGTLWGTIPANELVTDPSVVQGSILSKDGVTVAPISHETEWRTGYISSFEFAYVGSDWFSKRSTRQTPGTIYFTIYDDAEHWGEESPYRYRVFGFSPTPVDNHFYYYYTYGSADPGFGHMQPYVWYERPADAESLDRLPWSTSWPPGVSFEGSTDEISVIWSRPDDGRPLIDTFNIEVV